MCVYLRDKFEVSSIILTSFRQRVGVGIGGGGNYILPPQNEPIKSLPRLGLRDRQFSVKFCMLQNLIKDVLN